VFLNLAVFQDNDYLLRIAEIDVSLISEGLPHTARIGARDTPT